MSNRSLKISQKDNFEGNFGYVYRSSAIFYFKKTNSFKTTISFMDYWSPKRSLEVMIIFSLRSNDGELVSRKNILFESGNVINYDGKEYPEFEGSIEVEVFASKNMVIPYSAIMVVYESKNSVSMVHSYGRIYNPHEIEEGRTITVGEESCWTIRDDKFVNSFCVFHNGHSLQPKQKIKLTATNHLNEKLVTEFQIDDLKPYSTHKLIPKELIGPKLIKFLDGKPGNMAMSFDLNSSFTRMLVGNETDSEFQVTHSNFNYSKHITDKAGKGNAYMHIPKAGFKDYEVIVYPDCAPGDYSIFKDNEISSDFTSGMRKSFKITDGYITFSEKKGIVPSRIVTALTAKPAKPNAKLPYECSLGIIHKLRPLKSTHWGLVSIEKNLESRIFIVPMDSVYGKNPDTSLTIFLYTEFSKKPFSFVMDENMLTKANEGIYVSKIFPELTNYNKQGRFAWYYFRSESYGGFQTYSTIESEQGSLTLEHSF